MISRANSMAFALAITADMLFGFSFAFAEVGDASDVAAPSAITASAVSGDLVDLRSAAHTIASDSRNVTMLRATVARTFGAKPVRNLMTADALLDFDPRYKDNLISGLNAGIVSQSAPTTYRPYVWGGSRTKSYPYVVALVGSRDICTGIVLEGNTVVTAAHCFCNNTIRHVHTGAAVYRGASVAIVGVPKTLDALDCTGRRYGRDIGLVYLGATTSLPSAKLATQDDLTQLLDRRPNVLRLVGYGLTKDGGLGTKNFVDLPVASSNCSGTVPLTTANVSDEDYYGCLPNRELVAGAVTLNQDACGGDSGAPLILEAGGVETVIALSSRSVARRRQCGDGGVYALCDAQVLAFVREAQATRP